MQKIFKKILALFISMIMVFLSIPNPSLYVWAEGDPVVNSIEVRQTYADGEYNVTKTIITILGDNLKGVYIGTSKEGAGFEEVKNKSVDSEVVQQFEVGNGGVIPNSILIGNKIIQIKQDELPTLSEVTRRIKIGKDQLTLKGTNLDLIKKDHDDNTADSDNRMYSVYYKSTGGTQQLDFQNTESFTGDSSTQTVVFKAEDIKGDAGIQNIIIEKNFQVEDPKVAGNQINIMIQKYYPKQFTLVHEIEPISDLIMNPNRGMTGDEVQFIASHGLDRYDVFFLRDLTDAFTNDNKGTDTSFIPNLNGKQVLKTHVPNGLEQGDYYVIFTNRIEDNQDPNEAIVKQLVIGQAPEYDKFTVIDSENKITIKSVSPTEGPDSGNTKVELTGRYFGSLNIDDFRPNSEEKKVITVDGTNETTMEISYGTQTTKNVTYENEEGNKVTEEKTSVGEYGEKKYNVESAKRTVKVIIGAVTKFAKKPNSSEYDYSFGGIDRISVYTQPITDVATNPLKDVVIETETVLKLTGFPNDIVIKDRAVWQDGKFKFISSTPKPEIEGVLPEKIQVEKDNNSSAYIISNEEDRMIAIYGENFFVHQYTNDANEKITRYPIVEFENGIKLNKNDITVSGSVYENGNPDLYFKVFNAQGIEVDGSEGNEMGTKILVKIPKDTIVSEIGPSYVKVINPVRNSNEAGLSGQKPNAVEFVLPSATKKPVIEEVKPNVVTVDGGEVVTIIGSNFETEAKVFIDGNEVKGIKVQGDGKKITFTAPPGREGKTQIQVMNSEGGIDVYPFEYVKTYTDPKLIDFSPKTGKTGTLVVVEGDNFLKPAPTATKDDIYKLIGTRILLEGEDINEYNKNDKKEIILKEYIAPNTLKILKAIDGKLNVAEYYHSVIFEDVNERFYTLDKNMNKEVVLSNGVDEKYIIKVLGNDIKADKEGGDTYTVTVDTNGITLVNDSDGNDKLELIMKTPFKVDENNIIIGDNVKVVDINKLYFTVPKLPGDGYYDVTVVNPDTKKDSKVDNQGFYYYTQPSSRPNIETIEPSEGSVDGGYTITIKANKEKTEGRDCFIDNGTEKTKVYIDGMMIPKEDVKVAIDGLSMEVIVPKLNIDIKEVYNTDRLTVAVVVVNPDGGSASKEDGFTYIVPISHPKINKITPVKGTAAGGNYVEITGEDFRFYEPYDDDNRDGSWQSDEDYQNLNNYSVKLGKEDDGTGGPDDFTNKNVEELKKEYNKEQYNKYGNYEGIVLPVLPKVYFGNKQAEVIEFGNGYLKVIAPRTQAGTVDIYVKNNDLGISNKVTYTYEGSSPKITSISPEGGKKQGGDRVEIHGQDFYTSDIKVYYKEGGSYKTKSVTQALVRFANITNKDIPREAENSGRIDNSRTTVRLDGGLTVNYDGINDTLNLNIVENQQNYTVTLPYDDETIYVPVSLLTYTDHAGQTYSYVNATRGDEWIRFEVSDRRLFIERGYSPKVEYVNSGHIVVHTPSYYTVGIVSLTVINPDGGEVSSKFEYKNPDSKPKITNITKDGKNPITETIDGKEMKILRMTYKGGNMVSILGSDFRENAFIQIGEILTINPSQITYQLPNKLTFEMPAVGEENIGKFFRVIVSNEDYGNAASDELTPPIYIQFTKGETAPSIEEIIPDKGPASGGNTVIIRGKDFREGLSVLIGDTIVPNEDVTLIDYKTIKVKMPPHQSGKFEVKVENPDGELSEPSGEYTYLSAPTIVTVVDPNDPAESSIISSISVEGGQEIKIKGSGFVEGARVVFGPVIEKSNEEGKEKIYINGEEWNLMEGTDGTEVKFIDEGTLIVKTPAGKLDSIGIMVINSDGGATKIYEGIKYGLPDLPVPTEVTAELLYDRYIKVNWNQVNDAEEYEIYVVIDDHEKYVVGNTELTSFIYQDLEPNTRYKFVVTALGKYGNSKYSKTSNGVRTGDRVGPKDEDGELGENTTIEKVGNKANIIIGEDDFEKALNIDLTRGDLVGAKEIIISIPSSVAANYDAKDITITGQAFRVKLNPKNFYSGAIRENKYKRDSGIRFSIKPEGRVEKGIIGKTALSKQYELKAYVYAGQNNTEMSYLPAYIQIALDVDREKADIRRVKYISLNVYDEDERKWIPIANGSKDSFSIMGVTDKIGKFAVLGSRR
ncbi:IPT/TIG domain-containing protein [Crassaminicella indica]|uniref:IPT/TIG domain-containing protein n=1 Tax=Crassaminicella indica TaxID=2855394 RepID=A0ABX8RIL6_9CLOT|nr:IPT/TIG domain-containing protein [Crassaminicella indica]QXM06756.1 IPT/TIG domain-containing protein [Crassaminicella indica]